ncbi:MAG: hypothetical protein K8F30_13345, partial [Taibaiella sp.]|nr:hypothetical protein [Taibaiella sp.]
MAKDSASGLRWQLLVMALSMLVLSCFVSYWLRSQYFSEKEILRKELQAELAHIQREMTDSLLFGRYVRPSLAIGKTQSTPADSQFRQNRTITFYNSGEAKNLLDSLKPLIAGRHPAVESTVVLVEPG